MNARGTTNHVALQQSPDDALLEARKGERRWRQHSPRRDDERLACKQGGAPGVHIGHEPEAVIMNHVSLRREFVQCARETRRAAQVAHHRYARPVPGKATAAIVVDRDVTPIRPRYRKQSRFRADHCQRLAKPRDRVGRSAMGWVEPGDDMHGTQRMAIQTGTRVRVAFCDEFFRGR